MRGRSIIAFAVLMFLSVGAFAAEPSAERTDELMHKSGLWNQLAEMAPLFSQGVDDASSRMGGANAPSLEALRQAFATAYSADRLRPAVARGTYSIEGEPGSGTGRAGGAGGAGGDRASRNRTGELRGVGVGR